MNEDPGSVGWDEWSESHHLSPIPCGGTRPPRPIYESGFVKPSGARLFLAGVPHIPLAFGVGRSGPVRPTAVDGDPGFCHTFLEPEAEGVSLLLAWFVYELGPA